MSKEKKLWFLKLLLRPFFITSITIVKNILSDHNKKAKFQRQFYAVGLDKHLDNLHKNCLTLPKEAIKNETKTAADKRHIHFHVDIIERATQNIMTIKDHFSSYQDAILVKSEKAEDLKEGLIVLTGSGCWEEVRKGCQQMLGEV